MLGTTIGEFGAPGSSGSSGGSAGAVVLKPSGDTTGVTDQAAIIAALNSLPSTGGQIALSAGKFWTASAIPLTTKPVLFTGQGAGVDWNSGADAPWNPITQIVRAGSDPSAMFTITGPVAIVDFDQIALDCNNVAISGITGDRWMGGGSRATLAIRNAVGYCIDLTTTAIAANINTMGLRFGVLYLRGGGLVRCSGNFAALSDTTHNSFGRIIGLQSGQNDRTVTDASISGTTLTSASANFTAADLFKTVFTTGTGLASQITAVLSSTQVTVALTGTINASTVTIATAGLHFEYADNNDFLGVFISKQASLGFSVWFGHNATSNYIFHLEAPGGVMATVPTAAGSGNMIYGYDTDNNQPLPVQQTGSVLMFTTNGLNSTGWYGVSLRYPTLISNNAGTSLNGIRFLDVNTGKQMFIRGLAAAGGLAFLNNAFGAIVASISDTGIIASNGTDTSGGAAVTTPTPTSGTAFTPSSTQDSELSFAVSTATSFSITFGPSTGSENTLLSTTALPVGTFFNKRIPKAWKVIITGTIADLENIRVTTC